jgi:hypothetical protein
MGARTALPLLLAEEAEADVVGHLPEVSLLEARALRDEARALVTKGINPRVHRNQKRFATKLAAENIFEALYLRWRDFKALSLRTGRQSRLSQIDRIFRRMCCPGLGSARCSRSPAPTW